MATSSRRSSAVRSTSWDDSPRRLQIGERLLEAMAGDLVDDLAVHLDESPVRVEREPRVPRGRRQTLDRDVVQAEVEDRVHHPRHRDRRAGADGDEQRVAIVAEALAGPRLECRDALVDLLVEPGRNVTAGGEIGAARLGGDREPVRNGHAESGHLGEADPLPPEELTAAARAFGEVEDVAHLRGESTLGRMPGQIVAMGGGGFMADRRSPLDDFMLSLSDVDASARLLRPDAVGDSDRAIAAFFEAFTPGLRAQLPALFGIPERPAEQLADAGRDLRVGRQHRERARRLAPARRRPRASRGLGARSGARRRERGRELLVRVLRDRLVRDRARPAPRRPRAPAGKLLPALRRRGAQTPCLSLARRRRIPARLCG